MKAIILAGGSGTRLHPLTLVVSKQLMPVYNKPMIYYPLSTVMLAGLREVLIISTPDEVPRFQALLGDGASLGLTLTYAVQQRPEGIAQAFVIAERFLDGDSACLILGDNLFHGTGLSDLLRPCVQAPAGATIFGTYVSNPEQYGVLELDAAGKVKSIEEKPTRPKSHYAIPGLYFYDADVVAFARRLTPSPRGELEITDLHAQYLAAGRLNVRLLSRGMTWLDTGTHQSLLEASNYIEAVETRTGLLVGSPEEVAFRMGWIDGPALEALALPLAKSVYGQRLQAIARNGHGG
jgi:glucose-1-phosphate thymidylyltransferase